MTQPTLKKGAEDVVFLVDVSSFIFRAYYTVGFLSKSDGTPTGAVFGVSNMLTSLYEKWQPRHLAAVMDSKTPTFRKDFYPDYKANRPPPPEDLVVQFPLVNKLIEAFGIPMLQKDGYEADDLIATAVRAAREQGLGCVIVSGDKDLMQLVGPGVIVYDTMKDKLWDAAAVEEKWGVTPAQLGDLLALMGDSSDNIPGVPGVGPKTAAPLVREYGDLESLLAAAPSLKSKATSKKLMEHAEQARLSRRLVTLCEAVPVELAPEFARYDGPREETLAPVLEEMEFTKLAERLFPRGGEKKAPVIEKQAPRSDYETITTLNRLEEVAAEIRKVGRFAVDLETTAKQAVCAEIVGVALAWREGAAVYIPVAHKEGENLSHDAVLRVLGPLLEDPSIGVIAQNVKYEDTIFRKCGIYIRNVVFDPMLASYLVRGENRTHNLDVLAQEYLGRKMITYDEVTEKTRGFQLTFDEVGVENATKYAAEDAEVALAVSNRMGPAVKEAEAEKLLHEVEIPLARVLCGMELAGITVDIELLGHMSRDFADRIALIEKRACAVAGHGFNLASPKQLQVILFEELCLPPQRKTKTGYSTDSEVLEVLAPMHELPSLLLDHRILSKLKGTYVDALPKLVNGVTKRIHTSFNQAVTATGRLSSSNPNLQNIPIRTEEGRAIRKAFIARPGHRIVSADYSQVELRVLAHLSEDPELVRAFRSGDDVHERTARAIFGYGLDEKVPYEHRAQAKTVNFGVIYGKTAFSLAKELNIPRGEARRFIDEYFRLYSGVHRFMDETIETAKKEKMVRTMLGRVRPLPEIDARNQGVRGQAERMARNTPIQGTAADLLKLAMIHVDRRLTEELPRAAMILTVHDELVFEVPEDDVDAAIALIREEMENALELRVPLEVDVGAGHNWAEAH